VGRDLYRAPALADAARVIQTAGSNCPFSLLVPSPSPTRILIAATSPLACNFYDGILGSLSRGGFELTLLSAPGRGLVEVSRRAGVASIAVPMEREIAPLQDIVSFCRLYRTIRRLRPTIVDASTPKAGLLAGVAAWLAGVPCRVYTLRGLRLETTTGGKRALLWVAEWISCRCAHRVICVSPSLGALAIRLRLVTPDRAIVLDRGNGGVDLERFSPAGRHLEATARLRQTLGIPANAPVIGFAGRFVKDKGIRELIAAFRWLRGKHPGLRLLLVGDFERGDPVEAETRRLIESSATIIRPGFVADAAPYYRLMDVLALPTYREGFPAVPLEAQASGVPVVTTNATGAVDSVLDGETGFLVPVGDAFALAKALGRLLDDAELRERMGQAARLRMERDFSRLSIEREQVWIYRRLLKQNADANTPVQSQPPAPGPAETGRATQRAFDLAGAAAAMAVLGLPMLFLAALVKIFLGSPILFCQSRPGWHGRLFTCLKFRTMTNAQDGEGRLLPDAERRTRFGNFLRRCSLDELPQLINVLRGEMSLVGPRPLLRTYLDRYSPRQMRRHDVRPGITGWAQVNGRNSVDWERRFAHDLWYVEHRSLGLDLRILAKTLAQIFRRDHLTKSGHAPMPEFRGRMLRTITVQDAGSQDIGIHDISAQNFRVQNQGGIAPCSVHGLRSSEQADLRAKSPG
jgi:lipopolysaccharide/colanic/teichoic acid biosynthesis glycosyltransferase/glycosyltransferase involved in cell wall biosynthesis